MVTGLAETTESGLISNLKETSNPVTSTLSYDNDDEGDSKNCTVGTNSLENLIDMDDSIDLLQSKHNSQEEEVIEQESSYKMDESSIKLSSIDPESISCEKMEISLTDNNQLKSNISVTTSSEIITTSNAPLLTTATSSLSSATSNITLTSLANDSSKIDSPTKKVIQNLDENRRKFESEIGRDIVRERKMRQELEANSSSTGMIILFRLFKFHL